jgi:hypothetical protein
MIQSSSIHTHTHTRPVLFLVCVFASLPPLCFLPQAAFVHHFITHFSRVVRKDPWVREASANCFEKFAPPQTHRFWGLDGFACRGAHGDEDSDDEDEVFCDPDTDPDILRKVYVLEGQMDDEDEDEEDGGGGDDDDDDAAGSNFALRPDGYADDQEGDEEVSLERRSCSCVV